MPHTRLNPPKERAFVSVSEAAETLCVSRETIRRRLADGQLRGFSLHGVKRVFRSELDRLLESGERP
jgi:excisionase family DNA binding protein